MFSPVTVLIAIMGYVFLLLLVAVWGEKQSKISKTVANSSVVYALSLAVFCTSWTYYGSVGKAATSGMTFFAIYFGPTLGIVFWWVVLRRMVRIKNKHRITSIADFISSRYNNSQALAALVTIMALVGIVPYIALQLKAVINTFNLISSEQSTSGFGSAIQHWSGPLVVVMMIAFTVLFGVRRLDPTERHQGMVLALASECVVKLVAFLAAGVFVTYWLFDGVGDIFAQASSSDLQSLQTLGTQNPAFSTWIVYLLLAMSAVHFLPRQFHVSVVENSNENHIRKAQWMFPLYMVLINIFVIPIALAGLLLQNPNPDSFVLGIPLASGARWLSLFVFIGGFSAATGMIMISAMTMSTMVTNHLVLPIVERLKVLSPIRRHLLQVRWVAVALFIGTGYLFDVTVGGSYMLVNMGMMSFAAVLQFAPAILFGLFWRKGNRVGALAGLSAGFIMWLYTLLLPAIARSGWLPDSFVTEGLFGLSLLRPEAFLGLTGLHWLTHSVFWTLASNIGCYVIGSLVAGTSKEERLIAEEMISILESDQHVRAHLDIETTIPLAEKANAIQMLYSRYFSDKRAREKCDLCISEICCKGKDRISIVELADLRAAAQRILAGSIGGASAYQAVRESKIFSEKETDSLSSWYAEMLAQLNVSPEELRNKVDHYQERESIIQQHATELEMQVMHRTDELSRTNEQLKSEIVERAKAEAARKAMQDELMDTSRKVGMAEVATNILHNVGNVLNSINVSTAVIRSTLRDSNVGLLAKVSDLIDEHCDDLPTFFKENPKGKALPVFLSKLSGALGRENEQLVELVDKLSHNVEHVKEIISTQQDYSKVGGISQVVSIDKILNDAIRINAAGLKRHHVDLQRNVEGLSELTVDRTKVVQILVNLISNAKYAVSDAERSERKIVITARARNTVAEIAVADNGHGISEENIVKIFQHGFTTKRDGHGFGLHSSANAAREMGGDLSVHSEGKKKGATFTLTFPISG